jgi:hypothetical protein
MLEIRFDRQSRLAFIVACVTLAACWFGFSTAIGQLGMHIRKDAVELRKRLDNIPTTLGDWRTAGDSRRLTEEMVEELGTSDYLNRTYIREDKPEWPAVQLHLAYYTGLIDPVPHIPERCNVAAGLVSQGQATTHALDIDRTEWAEDELLNLHRSEPYPVVSVRNPITGRRESIRMPLGDLEIRVTDFALPEQPDLRVIAGYFFIANGGVTSTPEGVKLLSFRLTEKYAYYCKVQFTVAGDQDELTLERFVAVASDFTEALLPELMRCLPDWSEVERRNTDTQAD